jgi:hypothetical protein
MRPGRKSKRNWLAILTAPIWIPLVLIVGVPLALIFRLLQMFGWVKPDEPIDLRPEEVAEYLRDFIEGTGGDWAWDDFENMKLKDPELEAIRDEACSAGPPYADVDKLKECLAKAEALAAQARVQALTHQPG